MTHSLKYMHEFETKFYSGKINYTTPNSLVGKKLAGIAGHRYVGIDELVNQGKIKRINGNNEIQNLEKVLSNRVDLTLLPSSSFMVKAFEKYSKAFS